MGVEWLYHVYCQLLPCWVHEPLPPASSLIVTNTIYCDHHYYCDHQYAIYCDQHYILWPSLLLWPLICNILWQIILYIVTILILVTITIYCDQYCPHQLCAGEGSTAETRGLAGNLAPATQPQLQLHSCSLVTLSAGLTSAQHTLSSSFSSSTLVKCANVCSYKVYLHLWILTFGKWAAISLHQSLLCHAASLLKCASKV